MPERNPQDDNCEDCGKPLGSTETVCHECGPDGKEVAQEIAGYEPQESRNRDRYTPPSPPEPDNGSEAGDFLAAAMGGTDNKFASEKSPDKKTSAPSETRLEMDEAILPFGQIDAVSQQERARHFRQNGGSVPSTEGLRDRLNETVENLIRHEDTRIVKSPTSLGKTYGIASKRWNAYDHITDDKRVYHLLPTREARDEAVEVAREHDVEMHVLKSGRELCPVCRGEHDPDKNDTTDITYDGVAASEIMRRMLDEVDKAIPFSKVHDWLDRNNDQNIDLPCQREGECPAFEQYRVDREGDHGLTIATHSFAHVPNVVESKNVVIDEQPDFTSDIHIGVMREAATSYLDEVGCMVDTFEDLLQIGKSDDPERELAELVAGEVRLNGTAAYKSLKKMNESEEGQRDFDVHTAASVEGLTVGEYKDAVWEEFLEQLDRDPSDEWLFECKNGHAKAQPFAKAIALLEKQPSGEYIGEVRYSPPRPDAHANDSSTWNRSVLRICLDSRNEVTQAWSVPDLRGARSVVGLDAHPQDPVWQVNTMSTMREKDPLTIEEESRWRRYERGLHTIQVGDATRPLASGEYFNWDYVRTLVEAMYEYSNGSFRTALTTKAAASKLKQIMEDVGCPDPEVMTFGMEKSRNDFANEDVGLVLGCLDPGDRMIMDYITALGYDARPERADVCCEHCGDREEQPNEAGDGCHRCNHSGWAREKGRNFVGEDAEAAEAVLASVRESHVAQAAGRYARNPEDPEDSAEVFIATDAIPDGFADVKVPGVLKTYTKKQRAIVRVLREAEEALSARQIRDRAEVDVSERHIRKTLNDLTDHGVIESNPLEGPHGRTLYADTGLAETGVADVGGERRNDPVWDVSNTWAVRVCSPTEELRHSTDDEDDAVAETDAVDEEITAGVPPDDTT